MLLTFKLILCSILGYINGMIRCLDRMVNLQFQPFFEEHERLDHLHKEAIFDFSTWNLGQPHEYILYIVSKGT